MKRDLGLYIEDILNSIKLIESYSKNLTVEKLRKNIKTQDAIIRRLEIIGEASGALMKYLPKKYSYIKLEDYVDIRNFLIHVYFGLNHKKLLKITKQDIPELKNQMMKIKEDLKK